MVREHTPTRQRELPSAEEREIRIHARPPTVVRALLQAWRISMTSFPPLAAVFLLFCGASWQLFWVHTDAARYQCYALAFWQGGQGLHLLPENQCAFLHLPGNTPAFHLLPLEYPPLTLTLFSPALVAPLAWYQVAFALLMALAALLLYWLLQRYGPRGAGPAYTFYLVIGAWATAEGRFDLIPAGLTLLCLIAAERRRWTLAYIALALAFLLKIYPLLLLPALFMSEQMAAGRLHRPAGPLTLRQLPGEIWQTLRRAGSWRWKRLLVFCGLSGAIEGLFALLNFQGALVSQLSYFAGRPVQVEATGSTVLWLATLFGHRATVVYTFGSINIESSLGTAVALACGGCFLLGYALVLFQQWRGALDIVQAFIAVILVFVVTGKVFSPQYLIWLIPLLAYSGAFNRLWLLLWSPLSLLTTAVYPYLYMQARNATLVPAVPGFIECVTIRNALLVVITLAFLLNWWRLKQRRFPVSADTSALPEPHPE